MQNRLSPAKFLAKSLGGLTAASVLLSATPASAGDYVLPTIAWGKDIITILAANFDAVAAKYKKTPLELANLCLREKHLGIDRGGSLYYACKAPSNQAIPQFAPTPTNGGTQALQTYPSAETFLLHSKPGATRVIYLDFNGHTTTGTYWNSDFVAGGMPIVTPAFNTDGVAGSFGAGELAAIQEIWKRISEDYAPWDVDVTTQEPALDSLRKTTVSDVAYGVRVVIGGGSSWVGGVAGGIGYVGSFNWNTDTPVFVFPDELANGYAKYVAEAASHEVGHSLGLSHDGTTLGVEYYGGHNGWAPIMGDSYGSSLSQFSKGDYASGNNIENDLTIIDTFVPRSADLVGNDISTTVTLTGGTVAVTGIIESATDADLFRVNLAAGTINLTATSASPEADLDIALSLYNGTGTLVATANPAGMNATLSQSVAAGTYFIAVEGVGAGTAATSYTDYASIGQYSLTGTVPVSGNQAPTAVAGSSVTTGTAPVVVAFNSTGSTDPEGGALTYNWAFGDGTSSTLAAPSKTYSTAGTFVASLVVTDSGGLSASATRTITVSANQPPIAVSGASVTSGTAPVSVAFSSAGSTDPEGTTLTYAWLFGDGTSSTAANPSKTFSTAGTFLTTLTVTDGYGLTATATKTITVAANLAPTAVLAASATLGTAPLSVNFSGTASTDPEGGALTYLWNFGDGTTSTLASPTKVFAAGTFNVVLTVTDPVGLTGTATRTIAVTSQVMQTNLPPTAVIGSNVSTGVAPLAISFNSTGSSDPEGGLLTYAWNFGDGTTSILASPSKTYTTAGTYTVTLTVSDAMLSTATATKAITVNANKPPTAVAGVSATSGTTPLAVTFSSTGSADPEGGALTYAWTFGDGTSSTAANPTKTYSTAGTFTATLTVTDPVGLKGTSSKVITVTAAANKLYVASITMTKGTSSSGTRAIATVVVKDQNGAVKQNVKVVGNWSGLTTATGASANTTSTGTATLYSAYTKNAGTFTFTVTGLTLAGSTYTPAMNVVTSGSIVK